MRQQNPPRKSRVCFKTSRQWRHLPKLTDSETTPRTNISQLILQKTPEIASKMTPRIECWAQQTSRASTSVKAEDDSKSDDDSLIDGFQDLVDDGVPTFVDDSQSEDEGEAGEQDYPRKRARVVTDESAEQWIDYNQTNHVPESDDEMQRFRDHLKLLIQSLCNWAGSDTDGPSKDWMKMHRSERAMTRGFRSALISTNRED
ncbi:hypothetical protein EDB80DRAFT_689818 [Ilyonectria destructans]|nr:hypothetical protein EDB80DRAFT_689818 [Ilyonectria destructans]